MIVVDTTVWVDFFAGRSDKPHVAELLRLIDADAGIALTDVILTEILHGLRGDHTVRRVDKRLTAFDILRLRTLDDFRDAAALYRHAARPRRSRLQGGGDDRATNCDRQRNAGPISLDGRTRHQIGYATQGE